MDQSGTLHTQTHTSPHAFRNTFIFLLSLGSMQESPGAMGVDGTYGNNVPAFLTKLWTLVEDPDTSHLICWSAVSYSS